ncbi:DUF3560 domain-containing protein [Achromobacter spanius]|uniref:DUF3560 domain-containing protein n=1 Tax=Achromobacter spanius TaxID=217203 RepID=UPI0038032359
MNRYEEKQQIRRDRLAQRAQDAQTQGAAAMDRSRQMVAGIPAGQPILRGHHSESRHRGLLDRSWKTLGKGVALLEAAEDLQRRADSVGTGGISSDDPEAIPKLKAQLQTLQERQERMKAANKVIRARAGDHDAQKDGLLALGWLTNDQADDLLSGGFRGIGYPAYSLTNNNANIRRIGQRIKELEAVRDRNGVVIEAVGYVYREDVEDNRAGFTFTAKPALEVRNLLKKHGFRYSPSRNHAWVRQLTGNAIFAAGQVRVVLDSMNLPG